MNTVILAAAGGRKTQHIVDCCSAQIPRRRLVITFATTGQEVLRSRLRKACSPEELPEVSGWYAFLINHIIKPYLPDRYPGRTTNGLNYVTGQDPTRFRSGVERYFDDEGRVFSNRVGKLANDVATASRGSAVNRLEQIFDEIYIDEVQDLVGNDLEILELLLRSKIRITLVGDVRQSIFQTTRTDAKYKNYKSLNKVEWFRLMEAQGLCRIEYRAETWRCNQAIIDFADQVIPNRLGLPRTRSHQSARTGHDGLFVVAWDHLEDYIACFKPDALRDKINSRILAGSIASNFGQAKGMTVDRVLIYTTGPMEAFISKGAALADQSAARLYVAVTRAQHSVAFVAKNPSQLPFQRWTPDFSGPPS